MNEHIERWMEDVRRKGEEMRQSTEKDRIEDRVRAVRENLRRPPSWGPNEQGDYMVDMTVEAYEADLDALVRAALGEPEPARTRRVIPPE